MSTTIESLRIQVDASAQSASSGLDALTASLEKVKNATKGGLGLTSVASQLGKLNQAVSKLSSLGAANLRETIDALSGLKNLQGIKVSSTIARSIAEIGDATGHLGAEGVVLLREIAPALSSLSFVKDVRISANIGKQLGEITRAASTINTADLGKIAELSNTVSSLANLSDIRISSSIATQIINLAIAAEQIQGIDLSVFGNLAEALHPLSTLDRVTNLTSTLTQLKKLPEIMNQLAGADLATFKQQIQELATALSPLATNMQSIASGFSAFPQRIQRLVQSTNSLSQTNARAAQSYVDLYARIHMAVAAVRSAARVIAGWINDSNEYIENLNLFTASMGEYAANARKYAERVGELMGIDPSTWMRNQGVFMTLATGFGVASDRAYIMSQNLTQLGYDLSSFFNIKVEDAMQKLQSGISGELEPLRRLGYDLSEARLKAAALELGITQTYSAMTQAEKSQLRYYAIMTQVTTAQGDMARTLNAPANQLRVLQAQVGQAARALGNVFIPILNAVLPYCIALAKAIRLVAAAIASLFGFTLPEIDYSGIGAGIDNAAGGAGDLADNLGSAGGNAKKLKSYLMGFDELNIIDPTDSSGGGGGGGGGGGSSDWDWDLPAYDFLDGLVSSRIDSLMKEFQPVLDWIQEHLEEILAVAGAITAELLLWKIAKALIPDLGTIRGDLTKILSGVTAAATIVITAMLVYHFDNEFMETGKFGYLIADGIATAMGAFISGKVIAHAFGATAGYYTAATTFVISALTSMAVIFQNVSTDGFSANAAWLSVLTAVKGALAGSLIAKALGVKLLTGAAVGFTITAALTAMVNYAGIVTNPNSTIWDMAASAIVNAGTGALAGATLAKALGFSKLLGGGIGFSVTAAMSAIIGTGTVSAKDGSAWKILAGNVLSTALSALAGGLIAVGIGATIGTGAVIGATIGISLSAIATLVGISLKQNTLKMIVAWGKIALTAKDIEKTAKGLFEFDVTTTVSLIGSTLENEETAKKTLNEKMALFEADLNKIKLGVVVDDSKGTLTSLLDQLNGEKGIIASLQTALNEQQKTIELTVSLVPPKTTEGVDLSTSLIESIGFSNDILQSTATGIGEQLSQYIADGMVDGLTDNERYMIAELSGWLNRIETAVAQGKVSGEFGADLNILLSDLTRDSFSGVLDAYQTMVDELTASYTELEKQAYADAVAYAAGLTEAKAYYESIGDVVNAQKTQEALDAVNEQIENWDILASVESAVDAATAPGQAKVLAAFRDIFGGAMTTIVDQRPFTDLAGEVMNGLFDSMTVDNATEWSEGVQRRIDQAIKQAFGKDYEIAMNVANMFDLTGWDLLTDEVQMQIYDAFDSALGSAETWEIFKDIGYDMSGVIAQGIASGAWQVENKAGDLVLTLKDGTKVAVGKWDSTIVSMFDALGVDIVDGMVVGIDGEMNDSIKTLLDIFGIPYDKAADENEVHSPSKLFERLGTYIVEGLLAGLGTLYAKLKDTWSTLPSWFQTFVNKIVGMFTGMNVNVGDLFVNTKDDIQSAWSPVSGWFGTNVTDPTKSKFSTLASNIISLLLGAKTDTETNWKPMSGWFSKIVSSPIGDVFTTLGSSIVSLFKGAKTDTETAWSPVSGWFGTNVRNPIVALFTRLGFKNIGSESATGLKEGLLSVDMPILKPLVNLVRNGWETVSGWVHGLFGNTSNDERVALERKGWNTVTGWVNGLFGTTDNDERISLIKNGWTTVSSWVHGLFGTTKNDESVSLLKNGWSTVSKWVNTAFGNTSNDESVGLTKDGWSTVSAWVNSLMGNTAVTKAVGITNTSAWSTVASWIINNKMGSDVTKSIKVTQGWGFTDLAKWFLSLAIFGGDVTKTVYATLVKDPSNKSLNDTLGITDWTRTCYVKMVKSSSVKSLNDTLGITNWTRTCYVKLAKSGSGITWNGSISGSGSSTRITFKKDGGFVPAGQMFVAREAGPELVGSIGSKTAVANNDQIVEAVAAGVYSAVSQAMHESNGNGSNGRVVINLDGKTIYENQQGIARGRGYDLGMGAFSFG